MSGVCGGVGDDRFIADLTAAMPSAMAVLPASDRADSARGRVALAQSAAFFPLDRPVALATGGVAALRGYAWGPGGFPVDAAAATTLVQSMAEELLADGRLRVDGSHLSGVFSLIVVTPDAVLTATDPSGTYPVHIVAQRGRIAAASHSRPLATALGSKVDHQGVIQLAAFGYSMGRRTLFDGVSTMPAGASVTIDRETGRVVVVEQQVAYRAAELYSSRNEAADALWQDYRAGVREMTRRPGCAGLFLSGGFDSRFVAVGLAQEHREMTALTLGEADNMEVSQARRVAEVAEARWRRRTPVSYLDDLSDRVADVVSHAESAQWMQCDGGGRELVEDGATTLSTGLGGETFLGGLGGRYYVGVQSRRDRVLALAQRESPEPDLARPVTVADLGSMADVIVHDHGQLLDQLAGRLSQDMAPSLAKVRAALPDEVRAELARIVANGPTTRRQVGERFEMEHDVVKEHGRRELTLDMHAPLMLPLYDTAMLVRATNMDPRLKDDHRTYIRMARRHWGAFARLPTSVIPVSLRSPEAVIWASRAARVVWDKQQVKLQQRTQGQRGRRVGWTNYEQWARESSLLDQLPDLIDDQIISAAWLRQKLDKQRNWTEKFHEGREHLQYVTVSQMVAGFDR